MDMMFYEMHHKKNLPIRARVFQEQEMDDDLDVSFSQFQFIVLLSSPILNEDELINFGEKIYHDLVNLNHDVILVWDMQELIKK